MGTNSKSNAITAMPALLRLLALQGCLGPIDAMGCQTAIAGQSRAQGGDDLLAFTGNHKKAYCAVTKHFHKYIEPQEAWRTAENFFDACDNAHGRTVRRRVWVLTDLPALPELVKWPDLPAGSVGETMRMASRAAPITSDYRVYISRLVRAATALVRMLRQPWDIEHQLPWSLDGPCNEDRCRIRKDDAPENMTALRHVALELLRQEQAQHISVRQTRLLCRLDEYYLLTVLSGAT